MTKFKIQYHSGMHPCLLCSLHKITAVPKMTALYVKVVKL